MFFFSHKEYSSQKNGKIIVDTFLGSFNVIVGKGVQSGIVMEKMWKDAFRKMPKSFELKNILILGLGAGNTIELLQKKHNKAKITIVEWDEVMIDIAKDLHFFRMTENIEIIHGDAQVILPTIQGDFDFIAVDLFTGDIPPDFLIDESFLLALKNVLNENGILYVNFFRHTHFLKSYEKYFTCISSWIFGTNTLGMFRLK